MNGKDFGERPTGAPDGDAGALIDHAEPACPGCGLTAQVEPSRSEPGRWMCHGCAQVFDVPKEPR